MKAKCEIWVSLLSLLLFFPGISAQPGRTGISSALTISGKITDRTHNDDFLYDGFYLQTGGKLYFVKFPPHMAKAIYGCGNEVTVTGILKRSPEGVEEVHMLSVEGNGLLVNHVPPSRPAAVPVEGLIAGKGTVTQLQLNKKGDVSGYFLDDEIILRAPPHIVRQLTQLIRKDTTLEYTGIRKTLKEGEMAKGDYTIIRCQSVTINGTRYLTR